MNSMKNVVNDFLAVGWCWRNIVSAPPNNIYDNGESNVMQIDANYILNIDEEKNQNCSIGNASTTYMSDNNF